jgi:murein DD-endopeptidase MepM/ murein hydrolase activator NlpD
MRNTVDFLNSISQKSLPVLDRSINLSEYIPISISKENLALQSFDISSSKEWQAYMSKYLAEHNAKVAYGGYLEERNIYDRSGYFNSSKTAQRNIHLGIDLWAKENTKVLAVLEGTVHSFQNNQNYGDYGPTIILEHHIQDQQFFTLYGHLSLESIENLSVGTTFQKGECLGFLGDAAVNGDYAPHLHFQIIIDIENNFGDYPGVSSKSKLDFYENNCPNPNLLLKI